MHDLLIKGGTIVDGMGGEPYSGDVAIRDGRIVEICTIGGRRAIRSMPTGRW